MEDTVIVTEYWQRNPDGTVTFTLKIPGHPDRVTVYEKGKCPLFFSEDIDWVEQQKRVHRLGLPKQD